MGELIELNNYVESSNSTELIIPDDIFERVSYRDVIEHQQAKANNVLGRLLSAIELAAAGDAVEEGTKKDFRYVVDISEDMKQDIYAGRIKLDYSKDKSKMYAQIRQSNGHYGEKLPVKLEEFEGTIDYVQLAMMLQMKAMEQKLNTIMDALDDIGEDVITVLQGQQNDRIALYNSGISLYLEARSIQDESFRMLITAQALKTLSDGSEQLIQDMRSNIQYLLAGTYKKERGKSTECIDEKMFNINKCFDVIHRSYLLRSAIYYERGELQAMVSTMDEYGKFLNHEIIPYSDRLSEFDKSDVLLQDGRWDKRASLIEEIGNVKKQLLTTGTYYIGIEECADA